MQTQPTLSAREILAGEYGGSVNFMTPHRISVGKLARRVAYELSSGSGLEPGTSIFGVSVVRLYEDGSTERDFDASACFTTITGASEHIEHLRAIDAACDDGGHDA